VVVIILLIHFWCSDVSSSFVEKLKKKKQQQQRHRLREGRKSAVSQEQRRFARFVIFRRVASFLSRLPPLSDV